MNAESFIALKIDPETAAVGWTRWDVVEFDETWSCSGFHPVKGEFVLIAVPSLWMRLRDGIN